MPGKQPYSAEDLSRYFESLHDERKRQKSTTKEAGAKRRSLTVDQRERVLAKTGGRCHLCGGMIEGAWQADHVLAHSGGGSHEDDNYLPAHALCNNYRWHYTPEELQQILKLGVWARTQIQRLSTVGRAIAEGFLRHEGRRLARRRTSEQKTDRAL